MSSTYAAPLAAVEHGLDDLATIAFSGGRLGRASRTGIPPEGVPERLAAADAPRLSLASLGRHNADSGQRAVPSERAAAWTGGVAMDPQAIFDESELRAAEHRLEAALEAVDATAWVREYTEDAVFDGGGGHAVIGHSLLTMASSMTPLRSVSIRPLRTEGHGALAAVWVEGSWVSGAVESEPATTNVRGVIVWRKESDGVWRVAMEHIA